MSPSLYFSVKMSPFQISDSMFHEFVNSEDSCKISDSEDCVTEQASKFHSLLYSLITNIGVEFVGGILFFITAIYIVKDKLLCETAAAGEISF